MRLHLRLACNREPMSRDDRWRIDGGYFGNLEVGGLNVVLTLDSPEVMRDGGWIVALYIDARAAEAQATALETIWLGRAGGSPAGRAALFGDVLGVRRAPIAIEIQGRTRRLRIGPMLDLEIEALPGTDPSRPVTVDNDPYLARHALTEPRVIARSKSHRGSDFQFAWDMPDRSAFYGAFRLSGP
jgi:hypothetical protein